MANQHPAEFFGTPVNIIDHAGSRWLTAEQAGRCLGYNEANARQGIINLYNRHRDEFAEADAREINLISRDGRPRASLIFSATGCNLLGFFSNTPRAKDFRVWAKQALTAVLPAPTFAAPRALPGKPRATRHMERVVMDLFVAGRDMAEIGRQTGLSRATVSLMLHGKYQFAPGAGAPQAGPELIAAVAARHLAVEQERLAQQQERIAQRYLSTANNQALATALEQVGRQLQRRPAAALAAPKVEG